MSDINLKATPWAMLRHELESFISGQDAGARLDGLQIVTTPTDALWDDKVYGTWLGWETWANIVPIWGGAYQASVGNRADAAYFQILTNIDVPDATDKEAQKQADDLRGQIATKQEELNELDEEMGTAWVKFHKSQESLPPNRQKSFDSWLAGNYGPKIAGIRSTMQNLMSAFAAASNKAGGGYQAVGQALQDYNNPAFQLQQTDANGSELSYRTWSLQPDLKKWVKEAKKGEATTLSLSIDTHSKTSSKTTWGASANASFLYGIFSFGGSGSGSHSEVNVEEQDFGMSWEAEGFTSIRITAGQWFNQNVLQTFKNGPWLPKGPFGTGAAKPYGEGGVYALQPATIYVAYRPTVSATVDSHSYNEVKTQWKAGVSIGIGPFSFGGSTHGSKDDAKWDDSKRSFSLKSKSPHPQVVAVQSNVMPGN